jgi:putative SOS response-associated peptidase YedK
MCSHYQALKERDKYIRHFGVEPPVEPGKVDLWPGYLGAFIRRHPFANVGDEAVPSSEALTGLFGMVPHWSRDTKITRHTYNARSETVAEKPSFRDAWRRAQHCIIPAEAIYEPDWRSGKAVATRIVSATGEPLGIAGLWSAWKSAQGELVHSYTMLTINADDHALMRQFHKPGDEKRMVVVLAPDLYQDWLTAPVEQSLAFMRPCSAQALQASTLP